MNISTYQDSKYTYVLAKNLSKETRQTLLDQGWKYESHNKSQVSEVNGKRCFKISNERLYNRRYLPLPDIDVKPMSQSSSSDLSVGSPFSSSSTSNSIEDMDFGFEFDDSWPLFH